MPAIAAEQLGAEKEPEGIRWMLRYARSRARTRSVVHLRFGRALSLREALEQGAGGAATDLFTEVDVAKVAFEVCHRINDATPITPDRPGDARAAGGERASVDLAGGPG
ncbi:MAG TPA: hypothetical protein VHN80_18285, partial [Kineosporiaceae bacterium]|nr:hypothetical protein [Kineosporiaceae bacterium]